MQPHMTCLYVDVIDRFQTSEQNNEFFCETKFTSYNILEKRLYCFYRKKRLLTYYTEREIVVFRKRSTNSLAVKIQIIRRTCF